MIWVKCIIYLSKNIVIWAKSVTVVVVYFRLRQAVMSFPSITNVLQVFSFPFWKRISAWFRVIPVVIYFAVVSALCATIVKGKQPDQSGFSRMYEMVFIPAEEYMMFFLSWFFLYLFIRIEAYVFSDKQESNHKQVSALKQAAYVCGVVTIYAIFIVISFLTRHVTGNLIVFMIVFVFIFCFGACITVMFFKQIMGPFRKLARNEMSPTGDM